MADVTLNLFAHADGLMFLAAFCFEIKDALNLKPVKHPLRTHRRRWGSTANGRNQCPYRAFRLVSEIYFCTNSGTFVQGIHSIVQRSAETNTNFPAVKRILEPGFDPKPHGRPCLSIRP